MHAEARNHWQPVTDVYQQIIDPAAIASLDGDPQVLIDEARRKERQAAVKAPAGITAITSLYFLRAAVYALFAAKLAISADTEPGGWIVAHCPALIPIGFGGMDSKTLPTTMAETLAVMAVLALGVGIMWMLRWKPILFISVALSGYYITHIVLSYLKIADLGDPALFGPTQIDLVVVEGALNLLTFLFIALYPDLKHKFQRQY
jgi:hypothetical protein